MVAVEMAKDKSKDLCSGQSVFRRELMEAEELEIGITHRWVAEGERPRPRSDWALRHFEDGCLQWRSVHCRLLSGAIREAIRNLGVPGESGDVAGSGPIPWLAV